MVKPLSRSLWSTRRELPLSRRTFEDVHRNAFNLLLCDYSSLAELVSRRCFAHAGSADHVFLKFVACLAVYLRGIVGS